MALTMVAMRARQQWIHPERAVINHRMAGSYNDEEAFMLTTAEKFANIRAVVHPWTAWRAWTHVMRSKKPLTQMD